MGTKRIKGITIEIDGNTTKLTKALDSSNKTISKTQTALRDVNKLLKFDPTNTNLLKQKQDLLKTSIDETKKKLDQEKEALKQLKSADQTDKVKEQQQLLEREIAETESSLKALKKEYKEFGSVSSQQLKATADKMQQVSDKTKEIGNSLTKNVTGPIVAVGAAAIKAFDDVDDGLDIITKKTGATGEALKQMKQYAKELVGEIPTDYKNASSAIGQVNTRFNVTGEELKQLSKLFIEFAYLNETDVSNSIDGVQKALSAYGLSASYIPNILDQLNKTGQMTGVAVDSLTAGLIQNGTAFQEMGLNIDQSIRFMGQLERSGANQETVLQGLRKALKNATKEGKPLNQALEELQDTIAGNVDGVDGLQAAYDLFGKSGDQIYGAVKNGTISFSDLTTAVEDASGNLTTTFDETVDGVDQMRMTMNDLKSAGSDVGESLSTTLIPIFQKLSEFLTRFSTWWNGLSPKMQKTIFIIAGIVAAIGPLLVVIGSIIGLIANVTTVISFLTTANIALDASLLPIIAIIAAVVAAIAIIIIVVKHWGEICEWFKEVWKKIIDAVSIKIDEGKNKFSEFKDKINNFFDAIKSFAEKAKTWGRDLIDNFVNGIKEKIDKVKETVSTVANTVKDFLGFSEPKKGPLSNFHTFMPDMIDLMNEGILQSISSLNPSLERLAATLLIEPDINATQTMAITNSNDDAVNALSGKLDKLITLMQQQANKQIYLDSGELVGAMADGMNRKLGEELI